MALQPSLQEEEMNTGREERIGGQGSQVYP